METLLGVPVELLLAVSAGATTLLLLALGAVAVRRPLLLRLALRNPGRRPLQSLLITLGLTLSTLIVGTAFNTGDSMTNTIRTLVARGLGRVDEVVVALPRGGQRSPTEYIGALLNGSLLTGQGNYFPQEQAERLIAALADERTISGLSPAIGETVTVVNRDLQAVQGQVSLLALPPDYPPVFGALLDRADRTVSLAELESGTLVLNEDAAAVLAADVGTELDLRVRDRLLPMRVVEVVRGGDLGGAQPTMYLPLAELQRLTGREGSVNQVLVANAGQRTTSEQLSGPASRRLRVELADRRAAEALFGLLRGDAARAEIATAARNADGRVRSRLLALSGALAEPAVGDDFLDLVTDPELERRLIGMAGRLIGPSAGFGGLPEVSPLRVLEVKRVSQEQADRWGGALTSTFLILGLFSLATGALLVFLIFVTLAAERRGELGITRALGARRRDVIAAFLLEGAIYDLLASAAGLVLGVLVALAITALGDASLRQYGLRLEPRIEPRSLALAYCLGLLLTFVSVGASAWHISRLSVVTAIRNLPEPARRPRRRALLVPPLLVFAGPLLVAYGATQGAALPQAGGVALGLIGAALTLRLALAATPLGPVQRDRLAFSAGGAALLAYWLLPPDWPGVAALRPAPRSLDLFFLAGLSMVLGAVWLIVFNLEAVARPLVGATSGLHSVGLAVRTAVANPLQHRLRTGLIVAMFALVLFSMVVAGVLLTATHRAYSDPEALSGGFDIRLDPPRPMAAFDAGTALAGASAVRAEDFVEQGRFASRPGQVLQLGGPASLWRPYALVEVDAGFVGGLRSPLVARAHGFDSDADAWQAVLQRPGYAIVAGPAVGPRSVDPAAASGFRFHDLFQNDGRFEPRQVWARDERGGQAVQLTVIGVLDPRVSFGAGLYAGPQTVAAARMPEPQRTTFYLKARPGADPSALAVGLTLSLSEGGLRASPVGEEVRRVQNVRILLNQLLQGFFGVGLLAGLAALGVVSMRAVVERRQQIGMLRALGFRRGMVRLSLLLETTLIALLGIGLGVALGLALSGRLVDYLSRQFPEIVFGIPWGQIGLIALAAYLAALALTALPIWQIGRIQPAEALKYE